MTTLEEYAELARELDEIRAADEARGHQMRSDDTRLRGELATLDQRLETATEEYEELAKELGGLFSARVDRLPPAPPGDPDAGLKAAGTNLERAERGLRDARQLAYQPQILPRWSPIPRNTVIYAVWGLIFAVPQWLAILLGDEFTGAFGGLCLIPVVATCCGIATILILGKPKLGRPSKYAGHPNDEIPRPKVTAWFGLFVCWIVLALSWGILTVAARLFTNPL